MTGIQCGNVATMVIARHVADKITHIHDLHIRDHPIYLSLVAVTNKNQHTQESVYIANK